MSTNTNIVKSVSFSFYESSFYTILTFVCFNLFNLIVTYLMKNYTQIGNHANFWRFKNVFISWSHAIIASIFVVLK